MSAGSILVGLDFSDGSARALAEARSLAGKLGLKVVALHVAEGFPAAEPPLDVTAQRQMERARLAGATVEVRHGYPWVELVRYAHEVEPAMIVVGSHGVSGFQPLALGSTAARLALLSPFPVLVVTSSARGEAVESASERANSRSYS